MRANAIERVRLSEHATKKSADERRIFSLQNVPHYAVCD
jgi:hypothetical protein